MMKMELYLDIFRNGIRRLGQNIYFSLRLTSIQMGWLCLSIDRSRNLEGKRWSIRSISTSTYLPCQFPITISDRMMVAYSTKKKRKKWKNEIMYIYAHASALFVNFRVGLFLFFFSSLRSMFDKMMMMTQNSSNLSDRHKLFLWICIVKND
jgi:hypothetical protein